MKRHYRQALPQITRGMSRTHHWQTPVDSLVESHLPPQKCAVTRQEPS